MLVWHSCQICYPLEIKLLLFLLLLLVHFTDTDFRQGAFIECLCYTHLDPVYNLGTNVSRYTRGYAVELYVTLRCQFPCKSVPNGLQERPILGPLGLFVCGTVAQNNRAKLHHTLQYSSDNKAAMNTGGL